MIKRTVIDRIEILQDGTVQLRLAKQVVDGEKILMSEPHRTVIEPGINADDQMAAVNAHLTAMGWPACKDYADVKAHCTVAHTLERIAKRREIDQKNAEFMKVKQEVRK